VLWGITRDSVITIAEELGFEVREQTLPRETLYMADEVFFVGTAVEVTPIRSVDRVKVGRGKRGPITEAIQQRFFQIVKGDAPDTHGWLQFVGTPATATSGAGKTR
jgi:branched-chain amino acid aminotransferase